MAVKNLDNKTLMYIYSYIKERFPEIIITPEIMEEIVEAVLEHITIAQVDDLRS